MSIRNLNWYNLQTTRRYPLDDSAIGETDDGRNLPNDILVDAHIRFPESVGKHAYVQAITISAGLVTVLIGASEDTEAEGATIAAVSLVRPVSQNRNYDLQAFVPGTAGWITFGPGVLEANFAGRFASPKQSLISARCARPYRPLPIPSIGKQGLATTLSNQVTLVATSPVEAVYGQVTVNNKTVNAITFRLNRNDATLAYNPLSNFLSTCGQRPESGTCPKTPIETINGVAPDCYGNIQIDFTNLVGRNFTDCGGIDVLTPLSLSKVCDGRNVNKRTFYKDLCCPEVVADIAARDALPVTSLHVGTVVKTSTPVAYWKVTEIAGESVTWVETTETDAICGWPDPTALIPPDVVTQLPSVQDYPCVVLPACVDFCSCSEQPPLFETRRGTFKVIATDAPFGCVPCGQDSSVAPNTEADLKKTSSRNTYAAVDNSNTSLATFKNCATDWAYGKTISVQFKIGRDGLDRNGGLIINYYHDTSTTTPQVKYLAAVLDVSRGQLRLLRYVNNSYVTEAQEFFTVKTNQWYDMAVTPIFNGASVTIRVTATSVENPDRRVELVTAVPMNKYGQPTGAFGLYSSRSFTYFNRFTIDG